MIFYISLHSELPWCIQRGVYWFIYWCIWTVSVLMFLDLILIFLSRSGPVFIKHEVTLGDFYIRRRQSLWLVHSPPGRGWVWWGGGDTPSADAPRPETFRLGRWTPAGRDHSSKHPTETESTSPEPSAYWSKLVTLGPTANTSEGGGDRETDGRTEKETQRQRQRDRDRQTGLCCWFIHVDT